MLDRIRTLGEPRDRTLVIVALLGLGVGAVFHWTGRPELAVIVWGLATAPVLGGLFLQIVASLRKGDVGLDLVAALSMSGALLLGETLAGNVVALMYAGGQLLESYAQGRARREMTALLGRVAHTAMRFRDGELEEVDIAEIVPGNRLMIRQGEVVPVDGHLAEGSAALDLSALTGESVPVTLSPGNEVLSGATSLGKPFEMIASRLAAESTYANIVRLVEAAQSIKAPMVRLADRYAIWFLFATLAVAGLAWGLSEDPVRALAVLVVATPCPLILAVPVAIISGMSRTARIGVLVKGGGILEAMARIDTVILDKTGTITHGEAAVSEIRTVEGADENDLIRLAASLDQASGHVLATSLTQEAVRRGLKLTAPTSVSELPGSGIDGEVDGHHVRLGGDRYVLDGSTGVDPSELQSGIPRESLSVAVAIDGVVAGIIILDDRIRTDAAALLQRLRAAGAKRLVLASGDRASIVQAVGASLGFDEANGDMTPEGKVEAVRREARSGKVMMVGDGVNDAPALAAADVGVAMGARGTAASSEAAGAVLLVDQLGPLADAIAIAKRTRGIALQSVWIGLGLSFAAMIVAAFGYLPPVQGALVQEVIDVAVILNAMRALR